MYSLKSLLNKLSATSSKREAHSTSKAYIYGQKQAVWTERNYRKFASESYRLNNHAICLREYFFKHRSAWTGPTLQP